MPSVQVRGVFEHLLSVADQMLGVDDGKPDVIFAEQLGKHPFAFHLRKFAEVAVSPEKIEGVVDEPILFARGEFGLELGEIGTGLMDDDHFSVEDRLTGNV